MSWVMASLPESIVVKLGCVGMFGAMHFSKSTPRSAMLSIKGLVGLS